MHKKKVEEIQGWLELQKQPGLGCQAPRMLILSGAQVRTQLDIVHCSCILLCTGCELPQRLSAVALRRCQAYRCRRANRMWEVHGAAGAGEGAGLCAVRVAGPGAYPVA